MLAVRAAGVLWGSKMAGEEVWMSSGKTALADLLLLNEDYHGPSSHVVGWLRTSVSETKRSDAFCVQQRDVGSGAPGYDVAAGGRG